MVMGACGLATAVFAEAPSVSGVERVALAAEGGVAVEWTRPPGPVPVLGWHVERQLPGGGALRLTATRVAAGLFDSPATVYRFQDAGASARAGDRVAYRLVAVDPELREWPGDFAEQTVLAAEAAPSAAPAETSRSKAAPVRLAAAAATTLSGCGTSEKTATRKAATSATARLTPKAGRSIASAGSSKYITLTMRR